MIIISRQRECGYPQNQDKDEGQEKAKEAPHLRFISAGPMEECANDKKRTQCQRHICKPIDIGVLPIAASGGTGIGEPPIPVAADGVDAPPTRAKLCFTVNPVKTTNTASANARK